MADRNFSRVQAMQKEVKMVHCKVTFGASGAPTLTRDGDAVASVVRDAQGQFTITLQDKYVAFLGMTATLESTSAEDLTIQVNQEDVAAAKTIEVITHAAATDTDPADGTAIHFAFELKNSTVGE